jgi:hypothetical protein
MYSSERDLRILCYNWGNKLTARGAIEVPGKVANACKIGRAG